MTPRSPHDPIITTARSGGQELRRVRRPGRPLLQRVTRSVPVGGKKNPMLGAVADRSAEGVNCLRPAPAPEGFILPLPGSGTRVLDGQRHPAHARSRAAGRGNGKESCRSWLALVRILSRTRRSLSPADASSGSRADDRRTVRRQGDWAAVVSAAPSRPLRSHWT